MEYRTAVSPKDVKFYATEQLREEFLITGLFLEGKMKLVSSLLDRIIIGGAMPIEPIDLKAEEDTYFEYFLQSRELAVFNIGEKGLIHIDGIPYELACKDGMYIGMGARKITFSSKHPEKPAMFYFVSAPAHKSYPTVLIRSEHCLKSVIGSNEKGKLRNDYQYILPGQVESCQLVMGMTQLKQENVWNTMPCHRHERRTEVYLYFEMPEDSFVFHCMGEPEETRHIIARNNEAVISPGWSVHTGCGVKAYAIVWIMAGENKDIGDVEYVPFTQLK